MEGGRKRDRSDESGDVSNELEMSQAQLQTCKKLVANAAKYQGLSFDPTTTTVKLTNERQIFATTFRDFEFHHEDGSVSSGFGCFASAVLDPKNGIRRVEQLHRRSRLLAQLKRSRSIWTRISQQLPPSPPVD